MSNRTITYGRFLERFAPLIGMQSSDLQSDDKGIIQSFFNGAVRHIWEYARWPDVCTIEERTPDSNYVIAWDQAGETAVESFFGVFSADPHGSLTYDQLKYDIISSGIKLVGEDQSTDAVYVWYRKQVPDYTGSEWSDSASYAIGDQVYYTTTGDFYKATAVSSSQAPSETAYWERLTIPYRFVDYCIHSVYADWLRNDFQNEIATLQDRNAARILEKELDRLERDEGYINSPVTTTYLSELATN